jgi:hypothetical protein
MNDMYFFLEDNLSDPVLIRYSLTNIPLNDYISKDKRPNINNTFIFNAYLLKGLEGVNIPEYIDIKDETRELLDKIK